MKLIQLFIINVILTSSLFAQNDIHLVKELKKELKLEKDLKYEYLVTDNKYVCWSEFFTKTISCYNFEKDSLVNIKMTEGRGPHEYQTMLGLEIIDEVLHISDPNNFKILRIDLKSNKFLNDIPFKNQFFYFKSFNNNPIAVIVQPGFGNYSNPYLHSINFSERELTALNWTHTSNPPDLMENNFSGIFLMTTEYFVRAGNRINHLTIAKFDEEKFIQKIYDEPYKKNDSFNPTSGNLTQVLYFYIHDAELGAKNKLYLLAEGRTKNRAFKKDELTILDVETLQYEEETIKLPKAFTNMVITDKYFIGFSKEDYTLGFYRYE